MEFWETSKRSECRWWNLLIFFFFLIGDGFVCLYLACLQTPFATHRKLGFHNCGWCWLLLRSVLFFLGFCLAWNKVWVCVMIRVCPSFRAVVSKTWTSRFCWMLNKLCKITVFIEFYSFLPPRWSWPYFKFTVQHKNKMLRIYLDKF